MIVSMIGPASIHHSNCGAPFVASASVTHLKAKGTASVTSLAASIMDSAKQARNFRSSRSEGQT